MADVTRIEPKNKEAHFNLAVWFSTIGDSAQSIVAFQQVVNLDPTNYLAFSNLGVLYAQQGRMQEALKSYRTSVKLKPDYVEIYFNIGKAYQEIGDPKSITKAIKSFRTAVKLRPTYFEAYATLGGALTPLRQWKESAEILRDALKLRVRRTPDSAEGVYLLVHSLMQMCAWSELRPLYSHLRRLVELRLSSGQRPGVEPYAALTFPWDADILGQVARFHSKEIERTAAALRMSLSFNHLPKAKKELRVGLKSFDIGDHQSSYLIVEVLQLLQQRDGISLSIYGLRPDDGSSLRKIIIQTASLGGRGGRGGWFDGSAVPTPDIAQRINQDKIHVLIEMDSHFRNSRLQLMALRPAPVQVVYPMFVGSAGAAFLPQMFGDKISIPPEAVTFFSEKLVYLPGTYYANSHVLTGGEMHELGTASEDSRNRPPERMDDASRVKYGLPKDGHVICNFNQFYKIDEEIFDLWMRIMGEVSNSTLWLRKDSEVARDVLVERVKATLGGNGGERIVIASWVASSAEHVQRTTLASVSLDTPLYNSMTTACDTLWAGVPLVTNPNKYDKMVSRLASSLLMALGVPELVVRTDGDYVDLVSSLLRRSSRLQDVRRKMEQCRSKEQGLFDMGAKAEQIHKGLKMLWDQFKSSGKSNARAHVSVTSI